MMSCDLGTALMMFYDADGYRVLEDKDELNNPNLVQWVKLYFRNIGKNFKK